MVGRFKSKAVNIGDIPRITITTPMKIDELNEIMYEPNEYIYNNNDSISKCIAYIIFLTSISKVKFLYIYVIFRTI